MISRRALSLGMLAATLAGTVRPAFAVETIAIDDLYGPGGSFSERAAALDGVAVEIDGFMAPPLKAESVFFVLTKMPMAVCPFCEDEADWPKDIVSVYAREVITAAPFNRPIRVAGTLRLGVYRDAENGFVSKVRLTEASYWRL